MWAINRRILPVLGAVIMLFLCSGCGKGDSPTVPPAIPTANPTAESKSEPTKGEIVRLVTATPEAKAYSTLFKIPGGDDGISVWYGNEALYGLAVMPDGSFWVGDWHKGSSLDGGRLLHYSGRGKPMAVVIAPNDTPDMGGSVMDLEAIDGHIWGLVNGQATEISEDGRSISSIALPDLVDGAKMEHPVLVGGVNGEVLVNWDSTDTRGVLLADKESKPVTFASDKDGKTSAASTDSFQGSANIVYSARLDGTRGVVTVGKTTTIVDQPAPLVGIHLFHVNSDGSFYVMVEQGNGDQPPWQHILKFNSDGQLTSEAAVRIEGHYADVLRRFAIGTDGSIYALLDSAEKRSFEVARINFFAHGSVVPTLELPFYAPTPTEIPYVPPTPTPTPATLQEMVDQASAIAEIEVIKSLDGERVVQIRQWVKEITIEGGKGTYTQNVSSLLITGSNQELGLLEQGKRYLAFMDLPFIYLNEPECNRFTGDLKLATGAQGIFAIESDTIGRSGLPQYRGKPLASLEADILAAMLGKTLVTPSVDTGPEDLVRIAHAADIIAEVHLASADAATGFVFENFEVTKWIKKPDEFADIPISLIHGRCGDMLRASVHQRYILFINRNPKHESDYNGNFDQVTGADIGAYSLSEDGTYISWAGISYYNGWSVQQFEDEIQNALNNPGTPDPSLIPPWK